MKNARMIYFCCKRKENKNTAAFKRPAILIRELLTKQKQLYIYIHPGFHFAH